MPFGKKLNVSSIIEGKRRWLILAGIIFFVLIAVFFFNTVMMGRGAKHPIQFNHKSHKEQGLECVTCHQYAQTHTFAGSPKLEVCLECHEEPITESPEEAKIRKYADENEEIPWVPLYRMPGHVFFTHQRHVSGAGLQCETCHGKIGETVKPPPKPLKTLSMNACMDCHRKTGADNDCLACHN